RGSIAPSADLHLDLSPRAIPGWPLPSRCRFDRKNERPGRHSGRIFMSVVQSFDGPWWKEPTKDQWLAYLAAWLGWTLDAFDFTIFLLIMVPISQDFGVPLVDVLAVFTVTLWLRLVGATASGWLADRVGRKIPLMISIL